MTQLLRDEGIFKENVIQVIPDVYQITFHTANVLLIVENTITLIDTGYRAAAPRILDFINSLGRRPEEIGLIVITHNHPDHVGGLRELKNISGARVACHEADIVNDDRPPPLPRSVQRPLELRPFTRLRYRMGITAEEVEIPLKGGEVLAPLGGLDVIHTPGHTPGSICLYAPRHRLLIAADTLNRRNHGLYPARKAFSTDPAQVINSIEILAHLDFDTICLGHRQPITENAKEQLRNLIARSHIQKFTT